MYYEVSPTIVADIAPSRHTGKQSIIKRIQLLTAELLFLAFAALAWARARIFIIQTPRYTFIRVLPQGTQKYELHVTLWHVRTNTKNISLDSYTLGNRAGRPRWVR